MEPEPDDDYGRPTQKTNCAGFLESDRIKTLGLPQDGYLLTISQSIESSMRTRTTADVRRACAEFLDTASEFYRTPDFGIRVLAARPLRVRENGIRIARPANLVATDNTSASRSRNAS
jgi:hypothetical protein